MEVLSTAQDLSHICQPCLKSKRWRKVILIVTFILITFDLVTDWINWKQWSEVGGFEQHRSVNIFTTTFLCVAVVGTLLWTIETLTIVVKLFWINKLKYNDAEISPYQREKNKKEQKMKIDKTIKSPKHLEEKTGEQEMEN